MKVVKKQTVNVYPDIERGASLVIPVYLYDSADAPIILQDGEIYFTLKSCEFDFDYDDKCALIKKTAVLGDANTGRYDIRLSSKDTWLAPGAYYFDVMLRRGDDLFRLYSAETQITKAPSNRYQSDETAGLLFLNPISIGQNVVTPIKVTLNGSFVLNHKDMPLSAFPKFLLSENKAKNTKEIRHQTSRMRFPINLERKNFGKQFFIFDNITPFIFKENNPLGEIEFALDGSNYEIWKIPLKSEIKVYAASGIKTVRVGEAFQINPMEDFLIKICFENHTLFISGKDFGDEVLLMVEWFDFNI